MDSLTHYLMQNLELKTLGYLLCIFPYHLGDRIPVFPTWPSVSDTLKQV